MVTSKYSWKEMDPPADMNEWRVQEVFRDHMISLAELDRWVGEYNRGCLEGRDDFVKTVVRKAVGETKYELEMRKQRERFHKEAMRERAHALQEEAAAVEIRLERLRGDFESGYVPANEHCGTPGCMNGACINMRAYVEWQARGGVTID